MEDTRRRKRIMKGEKSEWEMNQERLQTLGKKLRVLEGRGGWGMVVPGDGY